MQKIRFVIIRAHNLSSFIQPQRLTIKYWIIITKQILIQGFSSCIHDFNSLKHIIYVAASENKAYFIANHVCLAVYLKSFKVKCMGIPKKFYIRVTHIFCQLDCNYKYISLGPHSLCRNVL